MFNGASSAADKGACPIKTIVMIATATDSARQISVFTDATSCAWSDTWQRLGTAATPAGGSEGLPAARQRACPVAVVNVRPGGPIIAPPHRRVESRVPLSGGQNAATGPIRHDKGASRQWWREPLFCPLVLSSEFGYRTARLLPRESGQFRDSFPWSATSATDEL